MADVSKFRRFVQEMTRLVERHGADEASMLDDGEALLAALVRRHTFDPASGQPRAFVSGYHNAILPNLWDRSRGS